MRNSLSGIDASLLCSLALGRNIEGAEPTLKRVVDALSPKAKPIGRAILNPRAKVSKAARKTAKAFRDWADQLPKYDPNPPTTACGSEYSMRAAWDPVHHYCYCFQTGGYV